MTRPLAPAGEFQRTLGGCVTFRGRGLFTGQEVRLSLAPAAPDEGIVFERTDLPGAPAARVQVAHAVAMERCSGLRIREGRVRTIEHVCAALVGLGVDNVRVRLDAEEPPHLDGSAAPYVEAILRAGIVEQPARARCLAVRSPITVEDGRALLRAEPYEDGLLVEFALDYGERFLRRASGAFRVEPSSFARHIAPARTYVLEQEIAEFRRRGLGGGADAENTLVVREDGSVSVPLRFADECLRHKVLDLLGDLAFLSARLAARIVAVASGHHANRALVRRILESARA